MPLKSPAGAEAESEAVLETAPEIILDSAPDLASADVDQIEVPPPSEEFNVAAAHFADSTSHEITSFTNNYSSGRRVNSTLIKDVNLDSNIARLEIETNRLVMQSGDSIEAPFSAFDTQGQKIVNTASIIECIIAGPDELIIKIYPECKIVAMFPGKLRLQAQYKNYLDEALISGPIEVEVVPRQISASEGGASFTLIKGQRALWMSYSRLVSNEWYRATISGILISDVGESASIEVIPTIGSDSGSCLNTLPANASRVACYFQAETDHVSIVVNYESDQPLNGRLVVEKVPDKRQFSVSYTKQGAKLIYIDKPLREYVFANESSISSSHFFRFNQEMVPARNVKITVSNFDYQVGLSVKWGGKECTKSMITVLPGQTSCTITNYQGGDVFIEVEGNNGVGLENAPAAVDGGTFYTLRITLEN